MNCKKCNSDDLPIIDIWDDDFQCYLQEYSYLCLICEDIQIERSNINKEWRYYEGVNAPESELPSFPRGEKKIL